MCSAFVILSLWFSFGFSLEFVVGLNRFFREIGTFGSLKEREMGAVKAEQRGYRLSPGETDMGKLISEILIRKRLDWEC